MLFANYDFTDKPDKWHIVRDKCGKREFVFTRGSQPSNWIV